MKKKKKIKKSFLLLITCGLIIGAGVFYISNKKEVAKPASNEVKDLMNKNNINETDYSKTLEYVLLNNIYDEKYLKEYKGEIYIGDLNIKDINSNVISNSFTYVSQNNYIINDTLKNNIIYHRNISNEEYEKMINICNLNILRSRSILRDNYVIEDNGFNISGGEKQKILLARSLLKNSNYIILDEALSEVSFDEEKEILDKIFESYSDKTIIYVSHKKEIIDLFKKKYKLERS